MWTLLTALLVCSMRGHLADGLIAHILSLLSTPSLASYTLVALYLGKLVGIIIRTRTSCSQVQGVSDFPGYRCLGRVEDELPTAMSALYGNNKRERPLRAERTRTTVNLEIFSFPLHK